MNLETQSVTIDLNWTRRNLGNDEDLLEALILVCVEDIPQLLQQLNAAAEEGSRERVRRHAHSLKGLLANFAAEPAGSLAQMLETATQEAETNCDWHALVKLVCQSSEDTIAELIREMKTSRGSIGKDSDNR